MEVADSVECSLPKVGYAVRHHFALTGSYRDTAMLLFNTFLDAEPSPARATITIGCKLSL